MQSHSKLALHDLPFFSKRIDQILIEFNNIAIILILRKYVFSLLDMHETCIGA